MEQVETIELINQNMISVKFSIMIGLIIEVFYVGLLSIAVVYIPDFFGNSILTVGFIILTLIITAGAVAMSYSSIQTEVSKVIMTPEEITIINSMNKVSKQLKKNELNLIRSNYVQKLEICTVDYSITLYLENYKKDKDLTKFNVQIMEFCSKHYPHAVNSEYFDEKNLYKLNEERTGTKINKKEK